MVQMKEEVYVGPLCWKTVTLEIFHEGIAHCLSPEGINNREEKPGGGGDRKILVRTRKQLPEPQ